ncbi:hypothetical protein [Methylorubrum podarium]|jgi:major curlin subunit|uniref:hypothetical protein n=1 Tax=Methylorubrum podarium TaxID=200476 RepID=UPI001EE3647A|nr:hypothetical protein [Methylorubrum podarium]GJE68881.1 hypothetical protein CHKEEEPN_0404 [Methylorubrum podarium]
MSSPARAVSPRRALCCACAGLLLTGLHSAADAQQAGVPIEYPTIGGIQIPIRVLQPDSGAVGGAGQLASNSQTGIGNSTEISQSGQGNRAGIVAIGNGNTALIGQQGLNNVGQGTLTGSGLRLDLQQIGAGNVADLGVNGPAGGSLTVLQRGDGNTATGSVPGSRDVSVTQLGNGASVDVSQGGVPKSIIINQVRAR